MTLKIVLLLVLSTAFTMFTFGQIKFSEEQFRVFDSKGNPASMDAVISAIPENDVIFLGELHDDAVGHAIQFEIFRRVVEQHAAGRKVALSLEMFERDVQIVVDEYLAGLIR